MCWRCAVRSTWPAPISRPTTSARACTVARCWPIRAMPRPVRCASLTRRSARSAGSVSSPTVPVTCRAVSCPIRIRARWHSCANGASRSATCARWWRAATACWRTTGTSASVVTAWHSISMAWSTSSMIAPASRPWASFRAHRAGPLRTSSRRRNRAPRWKPSKSRSAAPVLPPRWRALRRSRWPV
ncbi:hypothetical protein D3C73_1187510 [compost metagenome]